MKVCYFSSTRLGIEMFEYLKTLDCNITFNNVENQRITNYEELDYDIGISFLYTYKIPESEFKKNKIWINFHPGPLPDYRGRNLCYHAILEGAAEFGATVHYMDAEFDTGKIIDVLRFPIEPHHTSGDLSELAKNALVVLFKQYIPGLIKGEQPHTVEQQKDGRYFKQSVINEEVTLTEEQQKAVRALTVAPRFHAYTLINGRKYLFIPEEELNASI